MNVVRAGPNRLRWAEEDEKGLRSTQLNGKELVNFLDIDAKDTPFYGVHGKLYNILLNRLANFNATLVLYDIMTEGGIHNLGD